MYVVEVIPLTLLPSNVPQLLSYFFNRKLKKGAIVEIMLGNRKIRAVVTTSNPLENQKILLKKTGFQLKKVSDVISEIPQISSYQFKIALWLSKSYYAPLGYCLKTVLPPFFLKKNYDLKTKNWKLKTGNSTHKPLLLLTSAKETLATILPLIKKATAKQGQVVLIVPDISTIEYFYENLSPNYRIVKIHSGLNNKNLYESWNKIQSGKANLILGTRQALFAPFKNLKLLIVDDILHEFYKSDMTPKYNTPDLAKMVAIFNDARILFVSNISGVENYYHIKNKDYELLNETKTRSPLKIVSIVDEIKNGNFSLFSQELKNEILALINQFSQGKKILIFSPRRGHSGVLVCQNCGYAVKCKECGIAFRIHKTTDIILVCHHCSRNLKIPKNCPNCNSVKLKTAGPAGTQKIYEAIQKLVEYSGTGKVPILILDTDVVKNETEEEEIINEMKNPGTSILISTHMIFSHRYNIKFDLIGVLNTDSLVNIPDFKTEEGLFYQIEKLLDFLPADKQNPPKNMIIQTYNPEDLAILIASKGNHKDFYDKELETRKAFFYPPYSRLIKLTFRHKYQDKASYEARILSGKLKMAIAQMGLAQKVKLIDSHPSFIEKKGGLFAYHIVLKILPELENIKDILKYIPSNWSIDVDPKSIV